MNSSTAIGLAAGYLADRVFADPRRGHPVAAFGRVAGAAERRLWADERRPGVAYTAALVGGAVAVGVAAETAARHPWQRTAITAVATWAVLGGRSLEKEGEVMQSLISAGQADGDLAPARQRLSHLCSRDATHLDADDLARATVESLAENTSDAVTAPLLWGAVAGVPGLLGYRAANTLDAMVGYRSERYENFGWASAKFDDVLNYVPARVNARLTVAVAPFVGGSSADAWRVWRRDAAVHPSPNAGPVEASAAGALGVRLGGVNSYEGATENRGTLGDGPPPGVNDLPRAITLTRLVGVKALGVSLLVALARSALARRCGTGRGTVGGEN
ncbi:MAG: cobalamin biosynthesis protein [Dermatophilus congolensis]|nr:cobalamin biosynthesis protein [Dermatophilus congolensis]